jgi:hypothetical protein
MGDGHALIAFATMHEPLADAVHDGPSRLVNRLDLGEFRAIEATGVCGARLSAPDARTLELGAAENLKRVCLFHDAPEFADDAFWHSPFAIAPFVEIKTVWHPSAL